MGVSAAGLELPNHLSSTRKSDTWLCVVSCSVKHDLLLCEYVILLGMFMPHDTTGTEREREREREREDIGEARFQKPDKQKKIKGQQCKTPQLLLRPQWSKFPSFLSLSFSCECSNPPPLSLKITLTYFFLNTVLLRCEDHCVTASRFLYESKCNWILGLQFEISALRLPQHVC